MINVTSLSGTGLPDDLAAVGVPVHSTADGPVVAVDPAAVDGVALPTSLDADWCEQQGFSGKVAQTLVVRSLDGGPTVVLVGLGPADRLTGDAGTRIAAAGRGLLRALGRQERYRRVRASRR